MGWKLVETTDNIDGLCEAFMPEDFEALTEVVLRQIGQTSPYRDERSLCQLVRLLGLMDSMTQTNWADKIPCRQADPSRLLCLEKYYQS